MMTPRAWRRSFDAENLLFDWSPDGTRLALVVEDAESPQNNGIWIGSPEKADWWQVPFSNPILQEGEADKLHRLRKLRPVWSRDGRRFAFVVPGSSAGPMQRSADVLYVGEPAAQNVRELYQIKGAIRDVHWSPEGGRLGYLIERKRWINCEVRFCRTAFPTCW